jgi:hypothetical protein
MPEPTDVELDEQLLELERDVGPAVRAAYRRGAIRPGFAAQVRAGVLSAGAAAHHPRPLRIAHSRGRAALAAGLVGMLVVSGAVFANQPRRVSAAAVLEQLHAEAFEAIVQTDGPCPPSGAAHATGDALAFTPDGAGPGSLSITPSSGNVVSERLARAVGVSGDRVRQAMLATILPDFEAVPPEPIAAIARQLGKSPAEVCAAFGPPPSSADHATTRVGGRSGRHTEVALALGGTVIHLNSARADELSDAAQRLGVSPEQLLAAVRAAVPPALPPPPNEDELIRRLASNLGMDQAQVRSAIKQLQSTGHAVFEVPLPALGR